MPLTEADRLLVARYLDDNLIGTALAEFEARARDESALRKELRRQQELTLSLRRLFTPASMTSAQVMQAIGLGEPSSPSPFSAKESTVAEPSPVAGRVGLRSWRKFAIAAVLVGGIFGVWLAWPMFTTSPEVAPSPAAPRIITAAASYKAEIDSGFEPDWVCANDQEFINTFRDRFGQGLVMKPATARAHMLGLDYAKVLSPLTMTMLGKVDDQPVLVIIDRASQDKPESVNADLGDLHVFRREIGSLVLYEITPLNEPQMLNLIGKPDA